MSLIEYNTNDDEGLAIIWDVPRFQTFTSSYAITIVSVTLKLCRENTPGILTVGIRAVSDGKPTGSSLFTGTTLANTLPTLLSGDYEWRRIPLYAILDAGQYAIVASITSDNVNKVYWRTDGSSPTYDGGTAGYSLDVGSTWVVLSDYDMMFEIEGDYACSGSYTSYAKGSTDKVVKVAERTELVQVSPRTKLKEAKDYIPAGSWLGRFRRF